MKKLFTHISESDLDKPFRKKQLFQAVFSCGITDFNEITTVPAELKSKLSENYALSLVSEADRFVSSDGTVKFLFKLYDDNYVESVFLIDKNNRVTFCISSQIGCRMGCVFCQTGKMGLIRNLTSEEIVSQVISLYGYMKNDLKIDDRMFNIVYMGMGEPLDNFNELVSSLKMTTDKGFFGLSPSRITVSTCGMLDKIEPLLEEFPALRIAVSLNSSIQEKREKVMPVSVKYPVTDIFSVLSELFIKYKNRFTLEYVLIKGFNDGKEDIKELLKFNTNAFHINIIPLNHSDEIVKRPSEGDINYFMNELEKKKVCVTRRYRRGEDIKADCGQLYYAFKKDQG